MNLRPSNDTITLGVDDHPDDDPETVTIARNRSGKYIEVTVPIYESISEIATEQGLELIDAYNLWVDRIRLVSAVQSLHNISETWLDGTAEYQTVRSVLHTVDSLLELYTRHETYLDDPKISELIDCLRRLRSVSETILDHFESASTQTASEHT